MVNEIASTPALVLGTAQLGMAYGIANQAGAPTTQIANALVARALALGITTFDTARAYGLSENRLGEALAGHDDVTIITKLAPLRLASLMMGVWFMVNFVANWLAGIIGSFAETLGELAIFGGLAVTLFVFAVVLWLLSGTLVRWMHGAEDLRKA